MANFKFVINEPDTKKSYKAEVDQSKAVNFLGKKIGDEVDAASIGLSGYVLKITGGTDKDGFPMHASLHGTVKKRILLSGPPGFHPKLKGQRKRKTVRGDTISQDTIQVNAKIVKKGEKPLQEIFPSKEKPAKKKEEPKKEVKEEKKEEKSVETPKEEKKEGGQVPEAKG